MSVEPEVYKDAARRFASGVTIVTVEHRGEIHGMTASSFAAVSLQPPLILVSLRIDSRTRELILESGRFAVNVLSEDQVDLAKRFAVKGDKSFEDIPHQRSDEGVPLLEGAIACFSCETFRVIEAGDHEVFLGEVKSTAVRDGSPLIYFNRDYRSPSL